jgi:hypothetical protein
MSKSVFVSHATKDAPLVSELVDLIEGGVGVPEGEIFCSSLAGYGIPAGENFVGHMRDQMTAPKVVILVLTPNYFQSHFCLSELGAAWVKGHKIYPLLVPPLTFSDVTDVLLGTQVIEVANEIGYNELRKTLRELGLETMSDTKWDTRRKLFFSRLPGILASLPKPLSIDPAEYERLREKLAEAESELLNYEAESDKFKQRIELLEHTKDAQQVAAIKSAFADSSNLDAFKNLVEGISAMRITVGGSEVLKFMIADHYDHSYGMDLREYGDEFERAALKKIVSIDNRQVLWGSTRAKQLLSQLEEMDYLLNNDVAIKEISAEYKDRDVVMEPDNLEFWQEFYRI